MSAPTEERYVVTRTIAATPAAIFAVLANPTRHQDTEPGTWVRSAVDYEPITHAGQVFAVNMFLTFAGGDYVIHNLVDEFEKDATIAWLPGRLNDNGDHEKGCWWWRYDLTPNPSRADATDVTLTYDWSETNQQSRDTIGFPPFGIDYIEKSLATLEHTVIG